MTNDDFNDDDEYDSSSSSSSSSSYSSSSSSSSASYPHFYVGSMCLLRRLHLARSCASSPDNSLSDKSFLMLSNHLRFGLPHLQPHHYLAYVYVKTCPYHFHLLSCTFLDVSPTFVVPLILSFLILSSLVTPLIHLDILISATSNFFSCDFFTVHVSAPYMIAICIMNIAPAFRECFEKQNG